MEINNEKIAGRILNLTLEVLYLLTGEGYIFTKKTFEEPETSGNSSGRWSRTQNYTAVPPPHVMTQENNNEQKILQLTNKIVHLLTGEVWEYLEGHRNLYMDITVNDPSLTSQDGRNRTPEKCYIPIYSKDLPKEDQDISQDSQGEDLIDIKVEVLEEEEDVFEKSEEHCKEETPSTTTPCDGKNRKVVAEEDPILSAICDRKEKDIAVVKENPALGGIAVLSDGFGHKRSGPDTANINAECTSHTCNDFFPCVDCFTKKTSLISQKTIDVCKTQFSCSACGKCFTKKSNLVRHQIIHTGEKPFPCPECGKRFKTKSDLVKHKKTHTGERPFSCIECGKRFLGKSNLFYHQLIHTGEKPFPCSECSKCFTRKQQLLVHQRTHTGEKPFQCLECGRCFSNKCDLVFHEKTHTGERPFSCSKCGKSFIRKFRLIHHQKTCRHQET
ncbi:uncharacterized protein [Phyllobates terribilis]|uniref:uncharacterized protein n=1 Tax=Phyllobates terribilis TaxID=111132 RepID=UPI003CCB6E73